jgi:mRNA-degrading endonuclease toxin of MazEF toxin-antitoxin module
MELNKNIPRRGEIHWVDYNYKTQQGREIKKNRPSLVVSNNSQNEFDEQIIVAPLTTEEIETVRFFEVLVKKNTTNGLEKTSKILGNRLQTIDKAVRLKGRLGTVEPAIMQQVEQVF